jgi:hypothetical protein
MIGITGKTAERGFRQERASKCGTVSTYSMLLVSKAPTLVVEGKGQVGRNDRSTESNDKGSILAERKHLRFARSAWA